MNWIKSKWIALMGKNETLTSAITGIVVFIAFVILAFLVMALFRFANADTVVKDGWLVDSSAYLLLDRQIDSYSTFCSSGHNNDLTSDLGFDTTVFKKGIFEWHARVTHHSCSFSQDLPTYEAIGMGVVIRFTR